MKKVFICSPYRGNIVGNSKKTKYYAEIAAHCTVVPIAPHLYFTGFLDEKVPNERMLGIYLGIELMKVCDELWLFGCNITEGMKFELDTAREMKLPVRLFDAAMNPVEIKTLPLDDRFDQNYRDTIKGLKLLK